MIDEYHFLSKFLRTSYTDFNLMPVYMRKYLINKVVEQNTPSEGS